MLMLWNNISRIGVESIPQETDRRNVILSNQIASIVFLLNFALFFVLIIQSGWSMMSQFVLGGNLVIYLTILALNHYGFNRISRLILSLALSTFPFFSSVSIKLQDPAAIEESMYFSPRFFIMVTAIVPLLIFSVKEWRWLLVGLAGSLIPIFFFDLIHKLLNVGYYQRGFDSEGYPTFIAIANTSYLIFISATYFFKRITERYESANLKLISSLRKKNREMESQAKEIVVMNRNLEDVVNHRTKKVLDQALKFQQFSFKNSHELRAPLANIIGIMNLIKDVNTSDERQNLLNLLEISSRELDQIVREINDIINSERI